MEVETESDGSLSLCNVAAQFPNASGLKYIGNTNFWRGVRRVEESFFPPTRSGWGDTIYVVVLTHFGKSILILYFLLNPKKYSGVLLNKMDHCSSNAL